MKKSDDLFQLIKSLDKNEKRYFQLYTSLQTGSKNYLRLYSEIAKQKEYDEKKLLKTFEKEQFTKQFWVTKNYLYGILLDSLESYHQSVNSTLCSYRNKIEILYNKGLYKQAEKILAKAEQLALKFECETFLFDFLRWNITLMRAQTYIGKTEEDVDKIFEELFQAISRYKTENEYLLVSSKLFVKNIQKGFPRNSEELKEYKDISECPIEKKASSFVALHAFYYGKMFFAYLNNDYQTAYNYAQQSIKLIESNPHQIIENPVRYISALNELMVYQGHLKKYGETLETLKKLDIVPLKSQYIRNQVFRIKYDMALATYICTGDFDKGVKLINEIKQELQKSKVNLPSKQNEIILEYNMACIYFGAGDYLMANRHINKILNETTTDLDIHCFAQLISLIIHFELGKEDLLEYAVKATYRYLYKRKRLFRFETVILNFVRGLPKIADRKELLFAFSKLKEHTEELLKIPYENKIINYFDFVSWLESKIKDKPFSEVVKSKNKEGRI